jgi:hypothetical protein
MTCDSLNRFCIQKKHERTTSHLHLKNIVVLTIRMREIAYKLLRRIILLEKRIFVICKYRNHVFENWQLYDTKIIKQTIIITEIKNNNVLVYNTSTQRQRSTDNQQSRNQQRIDDFSISIFWKEIARTFATAKRRYHDDDKHVKRRIMNTQRTLIILQYNIKNNKESIMISLLIDSTMQQFNVLIIQKFWRNVCVSTSYNSFNIDFHLI